MNALMIAREYFPDAEDDWLESVVWNETGWPCFWRGDPQDSLRLQLAIVKAREEFLEFGYFDAEKQMRIAFDSSA
jgi:hypothetical protein